MILGASAIASDWPSRDLTVRFWPSSFSTVPRTRTGAGAGGVWASAGTTNTLMIATAIAVLRMVDPPLSVLALSGDTKVAWHPGVLRSHLGERSMAPGRLARRCTAT